MASAVMAPARQSAASPGLERVPALDGVRALASLMVVAYHFGPHIIRTPDSRFFFLLRLPRHGSEGVDFFFVLSGFLISRILVNARQSTQYFRTFYARRVFRIFPLYYLTLIGYTIAVLALGPGAAKLGRLFENPLPLWTYWAYLQNFAMAFVGTYGAIWMAGSWSLAIEEQFYFIMPAVVKAVSDRWLFRIAAAGVVLPVLLRALIQKTQVMPQMAGHALLPMRTDGLSAGIIVMLLLRNHSAWLERKRALLGWSAVAAGIAWLGFPMLPASISVRMGFLDNTLSAITFALLLLNILLTPAGWFSKLLSTPPLRLLGNMSYSTYLFHPILLCVAFRAMRGVDPQLNSVADFAPLAAALAATLVLSWMSWNWFERPILAHGHRFRF